MTGETIEQLCQRIMEARGYFVVESRIPLPLGVSEDPMWGGWHGILIQKTVITQETTFDDWAIQHGLCGEPIPPRDAVGDYFYRVIAE